METAWMWTCHCGGILAKMTHLLSKTRESSPSARSKMNVARTRKRPTRRDLVAFVVCEGEQKEEPMEVVGLGGGRLEGSVRVGGAPALMVYYVIL